MSAERDGTSDARARREEATTKRREGATPERREGATLERREEATPERREEATTERREGATTRGARRDRDDRRKVRKRSNAQSQRKSGRGRSQKDRNRQLPAERLAVRKIAEKKMIEGTNETKLAVSRKDSGDRRGRGPRRARTNQKMNCKRKLSSTSRIKGGGIVLGQTEGDMQSLERNTAASIMTRHHVDTRYIRTESIKFAPAIVNTATHHNTHCTMLLPGDRPLLYLPPTGEL